MLFIPHFYLLFMNTSTEVKTNHQHIYLGPNQCEARYQQTSMVHSKNNWGFMVVAAMEPRKTLQFLPSFKLVNSVSNN